MFEDKGADMNLLTQYKLGDLELSNRMVMAPMTRCRALSGNVPKVHPGIGGAAWMAPFQAPS